MSQKVSPFAYAGSNLDQRSKFNSKFQALAWAPGQWGRGPVILNGVSLAPIASSETCYNFSKIERTHCPEAARCPDPQPRVFK